MVLALVCAECVRAQNCAEIGKSAILHRSLNAAFYHAAFYNRFPPEDHPQSDYNAEIATEYNTNMYTTLCGSYCMLKTFHEGKYKLTILLTQSKASILSDTCIPEF